MKSFKDLREKTLTPAEKKKREEIAKAMERENPGMDMKKKMAIATWQAKKVAEAKDPNEYDKEGDMMKNQLRQICSANEKLMKMVGDDDNLPEWVQNKVTKATDYIRSVRDYLDAENSDEDDEDESMEESVTISPLQKIRMDKEKADRNKDDKDKSQAKRMTDKQYAGYKVKMKEEAEELDELSKKTLTSYVKKAAGDAVTKAYRAGDVRDKDSGKNYMKALGRQIGISTATNKLTKEEAEELDEISGAARAVMAISTARRLDRRADSRASADNKKPESGVIKPSPKKNTGYSPMSRPRFTNEEAEQIDELDKKTLGSYIKKASTNQIGNTAKVLAGKNDPETERARKRMGQRMSGIAKATDKLTKEEAEQIDELKKSTLGSYVKKASGNMAGNAAVAAAQASSSMGKSSPEIKRNIANRMKGIARATDKLTKEEAEQIDELSKKTLGSYVKKAKDDLGNREAEVTRNRYVDPRGVKDPVKHNNTLLMKRANRRDNINKAVDKLTKEAVQSADKKPEKYVRPDGKVGIRMVKTDKKMIKND
jgi:hypothetical protein